MTGRVAVVIPAAGAGDRLGSGTPKALRPLAGEPLLVHAVRALGQAGDVDVIVVAAPPGHLPAARQVLTSLPVRPELVVVAGGGTRQESVRSALAVLPVDVDVVLVHDAARPLVRTETIVAVIAAVRAGAGAVVPVLPLVDTVKRVRGDMVVETVSREDLRAVQTPQGFRCDVLVAAHEAAERDAVTATDDAGLVERLGGTVTTVAGSEDAFKVTRPADLVLAEALLTRRAARVG